MYILSIVLGAGIAISTPADLSLPKDNQFKTLTECAIAGAAYAAKLEAVMEKAKEGKLEIKCEPRSYISTSSSSGTWGGNNIQLVPR